MPPITFQQMLEYIARGHAFPKHTEGMDDIRSQMDGVNSFNDVDNTASIGARRANNVQSLGPSLNITRPEDLQDYMRRMIDSPSTRGFSKGKEGNIIHLFNSRDNTYMIINNLDRDMGTIHRYPKSRQNFLDELRDAQRSGELAQTFDNSKVRGAALKQVNKLLGNTKNPLALRASPGQVAARNPDYSGTQNLTRTGMSADYAKYTRHLDQLDMAKTGLDFGQGFVAAVDDSGRPSKIFALDDVANTVTEINGKELIVHSFENIDEAERAATAQQFFHMNKPAGQEIVQGGYGEIIKNFQIENPGKLPLAGSTSNAVISGIDKGTVTVAESIPYRSIGDAARAYIGFTDEQAILFNAISEDFSEMAPKLAELKDIDPSAINALEELSIAKGLGNTDQADDVVDGLKLFAETFDNLNDATRSGVFKALNSIGRTPVDDLARGTSAIIDTIDTASDLAKVAKTVKAGKPLLNLTKAGIITTVAMTTLAVSTTAYANTVVRDVADQLNTTQHLSDAAYKDWTIMMDDVGPMLTAQAADPLPTALIGTAIVERIAYNRFQEVSDKHRLPQNVHEMLSPSIVAGTSLRGEIGRDAFKFIPDNIENVPEVLSGLVQAKQGAVAATESYWNTYEDNRPPLWQAALMDSNMGMHGGFMKPPSQQITELNSEVIAAQEKVDSTRATFQKEFDNVLSSPTAARALADMMTPDQLFDIIEQTAKFDTENQNPLIREFVEAQAADAAWYDLKGAWNNWTRRDNAVEALMDSPETMRDFVSGVFVTERSPHINTQEELASLRERSQFENNPNFMMVAGVFEKLNEDQKIDSDDRKDIRDFIRNAKNDTDQAIIVELQSRYPDQMSEFINEGGLESDLPNTNTPVLEVAPLVKTNFRL